MSIYKINTLSGGTIDLSYVKDRFHGERLVLHVDQSNNITNCEDECSIAITDQEIKDLISLLNGYLLNKYGKPFVVIAEHLIDPSVKITVDVNHPSFLEYKKNHPDFNLDDLNK